MRLTARCSALFGAMVLVAPACFGPCAAAAPIVPSRTHLVGFRSDDAEALMIARKMLAKEISEMEGLGEANSPTTYMGTAWVRVSNSRPPILLVEYGCSPTGNCGLYGFERRKRHWRLVLNSDAQTCSILPSSHGGRRDLSASMHGSATESTVKTYWWRGNRYVRVSEREVIYR
jgi:hypothetical protein